MAYRYRLTEITQLNEITPGTQIAIKSPFGNLHESLRNFYFVVSDENYYYHHGVYLGDRLGGKCQVLQITGENKADARPCVGNIFELRNGAMDKKVYRVDYESIQALPVEQIVQKAKEVLANPEAWPQYNILANNCETFAAWLTTGKEISVQATKAVGRVKYFAAGLLQEVTKAKSTE